MSQPGYFMLIPGWSKQVFCPDSKILEVKDYNSTTSNNTWGDTLHTTSRNTYGMGIWRMCLALSLNALESTLRGSPPPTSVATWNMGLSVLAEWKENRLVLAKTFELSFKISLSHAYMHTHTSLDKGKSISILILSEWRAFWRVGLSMHFDV